MICGCDIAHYRDSARLLAAQGRKVIDHHHGDNGDIIDSVIAMIKSKRGQAKEFAKAIKTDAPMLHQCLHLWRWAKSSLFYIIDPDGWQIIKSPGAFREIGAGDCKSFAVLVSSVLYHWGVPHFVRFTSKDKRKAAPYTHVYVVAEIDGRRVAIDPVWTEFGTEHQHQKHRDFPMKIMSVSGIAAKQDAPGGKRRVSAPKVKLENMTDGQFSLLIHRQRMALKSQQAAQLGPRGRQLAEKYKRQATMADNLIEAAKHGPDMVDAAVDDIAVGGIGDIAAARKRRDNKPEKRPSDKKPRLQKLGDKIKKAAGTALKVVTAPARLAAKGAIEVLIPQSAIFFKYLFISDPKVVASLPAEAKRKRAQAEDVAKFITDGIGMKRQHFMGLLRNGILKHQGMEPEKLLARELQGKVNGVGFVEEAFKALMKLIELIKKATGKAGPKVDKNDMPADPKADGFGAPGSTSALVVANEIAKNTKDDLDDDDEATGGSSGGVRRGIC